MTTNNYEQILSWVNSIRAIYGASALTELVKGVACNGNHCPLANSLVSEEHGAYQADMAYDHYTIYLSYKLEYQGDLGMVQAFELEDGKFMYTLWGTIPDYIRDFLVEIDDNQHPDLAEHVIDPEDSYDEDHETFITPMTNREWIFEELDWDWEPIDIYDFYDSDDKGSFKEEDEEWWDDNENDWEGW